MANKGNRGHLKALSAPKYLGMHRKSRGKYVMRQLPGRHTFDKSIPLALFIEKTGLVLNLKNVKRIMSEGLVKVNNILIKEPKYPVGLSDVISISERSFKIGVNERGQISFDELKSKENSHIYKIIKKYKSKGGKVMISLHDGRILKDQKEANVNDSILIKNGKPAEVLSLKEGSNCMVIDGIHVGFKGKIKEIKKGNMHTGSSVIIESESDKKNALETLVRNIMVIS